MEQKSKVVLGYILRLQLLTICDIFLNSLGTVLKKEAKAWTYFGAHTCRQSFKNIKIHIQAMGDGVL